MITIYHKRGRCGLVVDFGGKILSTEGKPATGLSQNNRFSDFFIKGEVNMTPPDR